MFTLSDASTDTKKILTGIGIFTASLLVIFILFRVTMYVKGMFFPPPPPAAETAFGVLQQQVFPQNVTNQALTYSVNTVTGNLPQFPNQFKVYRIQQIQPDLLAVTKFQNKVVQSGFQAGYTTVSDKIFEWTSSIQYDQLDKRIRTNIVDGSFTITTATPYTTDKNILAGKNLPTQDKAIELSQNFLQNMQMIPVDIDLTKTKANLFFITNQGLSPATSLSTAQVIEVNFFQKDIDKTSIYYERPFSSNISFLVAGGELSYQGQIVGASYTHQEVSTLASSYPIKTSSQAFTQLKQGNGYIGSYFGSSTNINITDVSIGYYIGNQPQDFLMPIYVFKGDDGFVAYVPAVTDVWIGK